MLKKRVIVGLCFSDGVLTRTKHFIPDYRYTSNFVGQEAADEVFLVDVSRGERQGAAFWGGVKPYVDRCFCPMTVGGGIETIAQIEAAFLGGADKVLLGASSWNGRVEEVAKRWGSQAATVGVSISGSPLQAESISRALVNQGAGEILLQSIDRDGSLGGYDLELLGSVVRAVRVPVVIGGGCGGWRHMKEAFDAGADGCLTTVIHHFADSQLAAMKKNLGDNGVAVRPA